MTYMPVTTFYDMTIPRLEDFLGRTLQRNQYFQFYIVKAPVVGPSYVTAPVVDHYVGGGRNWAALLPLTWFMIRFM